MGSTYTISLQPVRRAGFFFLGGEAVKFELIRYSIVKSSLGSGLWTQDSTDSGPNMDFRAWSGSRDHRLLSRASYFTRTDVELCRPNNWLQT